MMFEEAPRKLVNAVVELFEGTEVDPPVALVFDPAPRTAVLLQVGKLQDTVASQTSTVRRPPRQRLCLMLRAPFQLKAAKAVQ